MSRYSAAWLAVIIGSGFALAAFAMHAAGYENSWKSMTVAAGLFIVAAVLFGNGP
jgi:hypothetical protein